MRQRFEAHIAKQKLFQPKERILLAFSAGVDSVVLAELLIAAGYEIAIAHCNFQLRGNESDANELFAMEFANKHGLKFYTKRFDTLNFAASEKISTQMAARTLRYNWFEFIRSSENYDSIAVAHHLSDSVETFFINLSRGTGIAGLHGIASLKEKIKRPLLLFTKKEIVAYALSENYTWQEDSSNQKDAYLRNNIRHHIIPAFEAINPNFENQMAETIAELSEVEVIKNNWLRELQAIGIDKADGIARIEIEWLSNLAQGKFFLTQTLKAFGFATTSINDCWDALPKQAGLQFFSASHRLVKDRTHLLIAELNNEAFSESKANSVFLWEQDTKMLDLGPLVITGMESNSVPDLSQMRPTEACLDANKLQFPLVIRKWQTGDFFQPLGMKGNKKLSDFFIDEKFSLIEKDNTFVMVSGNDIVWVIGHRISEHYKVNQNSNATYLFKIK